MSSRAAEVAARLARDAEAVCRHYLSAGRREGRYWRVGDVANTPGGSLYVRLHPPHAGRWADAATSEYGDLLDLIAARQGLGSLGAAIDEALRFLALPRPEAVAEPAPAGSPLAARRLFAAGRPLKATPAERYLQTRGLQRQGNDRWLRYHPACFYRGPDGDQVWPALLAGVTDLAGELQGVHRTWLTRAGTKAPVADPRRAMGRLLGHAVRFGQAEDVLAAGEGLESVLSVRQVLPRMPAAAALSAGHLGALLVPATVRRLYVVLDDDPAGRRAAERLTQRWPDVEAMADAELQDATRTARAADVAQAAAELVRDAAAEVYTTQTGEVWTAWRGSRRGTRLTAAQLEAKQAIRAIERRKAGEADPGGPVVAFRAAPFADSEADAHRIFDALNWAKAQWPDMALATTGAKGAERLAIRWAQQKGVTLVLAKADFDRHGKAAPFRANDELLALEPACCLTLAQSLDEGRAGRSHPFGPALNFAQQAQARGVRHMAIRARAA